jgi:hypothetical protein
MAKENVIKLFRDVQKKPDLKQKLNQSTSNVKFQKFLAYKNYKR